MEIISLYCFQDAAEFCRKYIQEWWEESEPEARKIVASCLHAGDNLPLILVAHENKSLRGIIMLCKDNSEVTEKYGPWLMLLQVPEKFRNQGIDKALVDEACRYLKRLGYSEVYIDTLTAREFYEHRGWELVDVANWHGEETVIMHKDL
jgi:predicted N-acetyltransferase YhbS